LDLILKIYRSKGEYLNILAQKNLGEKTDKLIMLFNETLIEPLKDVDYDTLECNEEENSIKLP
jgi:hypothetical protein